MIVVTWSEVAWFAVVFVGACAVMFGLIWADDRARGETRGSEPLSRLDVADGLRETKESDPWMP